MTLKRVYRVKRNLYIYRVRNFLLYPMWAIINNSHPMLTQRSRYVLWDCGAKQTNIPYGAKQTPTPGSGINFDTICNDLHPTM